MELPIKVDDLPANLAALVRDAQEEGLWGDAIDGFEDWLDEAGQRPAPVLIMLAFMLYHDALEVMVDEVEERGNEALALLAEANQPKQTAALRRDIQRAVSRDKAYNKEHAKEVAKTRDQPLESLTRQQVRDLAYKLGESGKPDEQVTAAHAWLRAAELASDDADRADCLARAALQFADGGAWDEAMPRLEQLVKNPTRYDWQVDYAWYRLLDKAIADGGPQLFATRWTDALATQRKDPFPFARPMQDKYLAYALDNQLTAIAKHIAGVVMELRSARERKPIQALLDRASELR